MDSRLIEFLIRAKQATYAGKGAETTPSHEKWNLMLFYYIKCSIIQS